MLELKFSIYHRAASLFSQASPVDSLTDPGLCSNTKSTMAWLHGWQTHCLHVHSHISKSAILSNQIMLHC